MLQQALDAACEKVMMNMSNSQNIYDNQTFFDGYKKLRENPHSANNLEEKPALFSLAPGII